MPPKRDFEQSRGLYDFLKLKSESGTEIFKIGEDYKVEPNARFFNEAKNSLRSLIEIEYA